MFTPSSPPRNTQDRSVQVRCPKGHPLLSLPPGEVVTLDRSQGEPRTLSCSEPGCGETVRVRVVVSHA